MNTHSLLYTSLYICSATSKPRLRGALVWGIVLHIQRSIQVILLVIIHSYVLGHLLAAIITLTKFSILTLASFVGIVTTSHDNTKSNKASVVAYLLWTVWQATNDFVKLLFIRFHVYHTTKTMLNHYIFTNINRATVNLLKISVQKTLLKSYVK